MIPELKGGSEESFFAGGKHYGQCSNGFESWDGEKLMKTLRILVLIFSMIALWANSQSKAATDLPLTLGLPDLTGFEMDVKYTASNGAFVVDGLTHDYIIPSGDVGIAIQDSYNLSATITTNAILTGGTLTIKGEVNGGGSDTTLLTGNLTTGAAGTAFGYGDGGNEIFQFLFTVSGGSLASAFGGNGAKGGIIFDAGFDSNQGDTPFTGSWTSNFNSNGSDDGVIDAFARPVPEPSSILLVLAGILGMVARCRLNAPRDKQRMTMLLMQPKEKSWL